MKQIDRQSKAICLVENLVRSLSTAAKHSIKNEKPGNLIAWGKRFLPNHFTQPPSAMHRWLAKKLQTVHRRRGEKLNVIGPRGGAKSTVVTLAYVLRAACEELEPYIWIVSDTHQQAAMHLANVQSELADNPLLAKHYPAAVGVGPRWRASAIELRNGVVIEAYGTGQRIRGRRRGAHRPTLIVCDDLQNDSHIASALQRDSSRSWFHGTLLKAGTPATNIVNLATALHRHAIAMELIDNPGWRSKLFPAIKKWPTRSDLWHEWESLYLRTDVEDPAVAARKYFLRHQVAMQAGAKVLWPAVEDLYTLMCMRVESGRTAFEREKQGSPIDPESCEWPESYFGDEIWFDTWPDNMVLRVMALDPSKGTDARRGDFSAFVMLGIDPAGVLYVEADLARRPTPQMVADGVALHQRFHPAVFGIEANQWQELLADEFTTEMRRSHLLGDEPVGIHNTMNKLVRIRRLGPYLARRRIKFLRSSGSTRLLVDQLRDFPASTHDDGPDALEMALRLAEQTWQGRHAPDDGLGTRLPIQS